MYYIEYVAIWGGWERCELLSGDIDQATICALCFIRGAKRAGHEIKEYRIVYEPAKSV